MIGKATDAFKALAYAMENEPKLAREVLFEMSTEDLDELADGVEILAVEVDTVAIARAEKRATQRCCANHTSRCQLDRPACCPYCPATPLEDVEPI